MYFLFKIKNVLFFSRSKMYFFIIYDEMMVFVWLRKGKLVKLGFDLCRLNIFELSVVFSLNKYKFRILNIELTFKFKMLSFPKSVMLC